MVRPGVVRQELVGTAPRMEAIRRRITRVPSHADGSRTRFQDMDI